MTRVRKAVIPAAGYGLNFLPATKAQPKELLPIVDKPIIQFIVEEAFDSGIEEVLIITGKHKRSVEDHFDSNKALEQNLRSKNKHELLEIANSTTRDNIFFVRQSYPKGLGDAILHARTFIGDEPFVVLLGDNITECEVPMTKQLIDLYEEEKLPNLAVIQVNPEETYKYGIIDVDEDYESADEDVHAVKEFIEKPDAEDAPSNLAIAGRYVLTPEIFDILEEIETDINDELQLTDAIDVLNNSQRVLAKEIKGNRYDVGDRIGYIKFSIDYGLKHPETKEEFTQFIKELSEKL